MKFALARAKVVLASGIGLEHRISFVARLVNQLKSK